MTAMRRSAALAAVLAVIAVSGSTPAARALNRPEVDPAAVPSDGTPGPERPMRQSNLCARTTTVADPDVSATAPGFIMLNIAQAWQHSTGNGVAVAVIDTGVNPSSRLPVVAGGDYIMGGDGLLDCDAHGTTVASVIAAAPRGRPMPAPLPQRPAFPPPVGPPPVTTAPPPPGEQPPPPAPQPPPAPVTITETVAEPPPVPPPAADQAQVAPAAGMGYAHFGPLPQVPAPEPAALDGVAGVAPHATVISIRQSSRAYEYVDPLPGFSETHRKAGTLATLALAVVHAANLGAQVINISVTSCLPVSDPLDQRALGAALWYAATVKNAVVVAASGNEGEQFCEQNPVFNPLNTNDPRDWDRVKTISSPSWFADYVLSVGAVDNAGAPLGRSLSGPWVSVAAPGIGIIGLSPYDASAVNAYPPTRAGGENTPFWGTSFAAAYVSGVVALVRAKFPELTAHQVVNRIAQTCHNPPGGVDNRVGYGVVDPVAALTFDVPAGPVVAPGSASRVMTAEPPPSPPDHRARNAALIYGVALTALVGFIALAARARRAR